MLPLSESSGLRILMTLDACGGVWRYAMNLATGLRQAGAKVVLAGFGPPPNAAQRAEAEAVGTLDWTGLPLDWTCRDAAELDPVGPAISERARSHDVDVIHLNLPSQAADIVTDRPVLAMSHSCVVTWFRAVHASRVPLDWSWQESINRRGLQHADRVVAPSKAHADLVETCYGRVAPVSVVHNAVSSPRAAAHPHGSTVFAAARWWDEGKNGAVLDGAAATAQWPIHAAGPCQSPQGDSFAFRHVSWLGEIPNGDVRRQMAEAGIFVSPSLYEPFGLATLEAAHAGLPLVLSDIPTYRELWDGAALFVAPRDPAAFAAALDGLSRDPGRRDRLASAARRRAGHYARHRQNATMLELYQELAGRVPSPTTPQEA